MGAIKDVVDLITQLEKKVKEREFLAPLREIQSAVSDLYTTNATLAETNQALREENSHLKAEIASLQKHMEETKAPHLQSETHLDEAAEKMLVFLANASNSLTKDMLIRHFQLSPARGDYFFDLLRERDFVKTAYAQMGVGAFWSVTPGGRRYLVNRGLI